MSLILFKPLNGYDISFLDYFHLVLYGFYLTIQPFLS
jgi:hypothetical protein